MRRNIRGKGGLRWTLLVRNLAVVAGVCLLIRFIADGAGGTPVVNDGLGKALLALELPFAQTEEEGSASEDLLSRELPGAAGTGKFKTESQLAGRDPTPEDKPAADTEGPEEPDDVEEDIEPPAVEDPKPEEPTAPQEPEVPLKDAISTTIRTSGDGYSGIAEGIYIKNRTDYTVDAEGLLKKPLSFGEGAAVLIVHTHGSEAYNPAGDDMYKESDPSRTEDKNFNVVRVGDELEKVLTDRGITVYHDRQLHDYPSYTGAYNRSLASIQKFMAEHKDIKVVIDLHRDALEGDGKLYKTVADVGDTPCAQVMLICGSNFSGLKHPDWQENMSFALKLQRRMVDLYPSLARPLKLSQYRYNQHISTGALIAEIGTNGNTLKEAITAARYFGQCLADVLTGES